MTTERDTFDDSVEEVRELMASADLEQDAEGIEQRGAALLQNRRQLFMLALAVLLMVVAIYVVFPKLVGVSDAIGKLEVSTLSTTDATRAAMRSCRLTCQCVYQSRIGSLRRRAEGAARTANSGTM